MKQLKKNAGVRTFTPYYINTGMFDVVKSVVPTLNPDKVAQKIITAIEHQRFFLSIPWSVGFVQFFRWVVLLSFLLGFKAKSWAYVRQCIISNEGNNVIPIFIFKPKHLRKQAYNTKKLFLSFEKKSRFKINKAAFAFI
ncbi:hypothetical protein ACFX5D_15250 [Flavobacterium sp. LB3P45]|uniref:Uncharacterized protein n=1 Tax=Flavobacterium fructosi TaxID=3230416 RepID=A0ABW6HRA8_9FLAO